MKAIPIAEHPSNLDLSGKLVASSSDVDRWWSVYRVRAGFLATVGDGLVLEGHFATQAEATIAAEKYFDNPEHAR